MPQTERNEKQTSGEPTRPDVPPHDLEPGYLPAAVDPRDPTGNKLFTRCLLAAVIVFAGCCIWLGFQDIYGTRRTAEEQHRIKVQVYRPPVKHPHKKPPPPPPPKKPPPPTKRIITKQVVHVQPRPTPRPPTPRPPAPINLGSHVNTPTAPPTEPPVTPEPPQPVVPQAPVPEPPKPEPPAPTPAPPTPKPVEVPKPKPPPPPPPPPPKPKPPPDRVEPEQTQGSFSDIQLPGDLDVTTLNSTDVEVSWEVDDQGRPRSIHFKPTGNSDVDDAIRRAISGFRYLPKRINGVTESVTIQHTFHLG